MTPGPAHILVADDSPINRKLLSQALKNLGYSCEVAEDGQQALEKIRSQSFDALLLDILMPVMDGYQVLTRLKEDPQLRTLPVIVISAVDDLESVIRCIEMGAEDYLPKPFNPLLLKARLQSSLEKKKLHDLERAFLEQEMRLQENEKLASIGRLSAGMAHELNNPAAATLRSTFHLTEALSALQSACQGLISQSFDAGQQQALQKAEALSANAAHPAALSPLERSEWQSQLETWLEDREVENAWEIAPVLVDVISSEQHLTELEKDFDRAALPAVLNWLASLGNLYTLTNEISHGAAHISRIVNALKSYTFLDQAPLQEIDLNGCLDDTLALLESRLDGIQIIKEYSPLPRLQAYPALLNQVWMHLLENALDALQGRGQIMLRTRRQDAWALVEIEDNGPGIPRDIQNRLFTPFLTTKPPGHGAGLGLSSSRNIIQKHDGELQFDSAGKRTLFRVKLPLRPPPG